MYTNWTSDNSVGNYWGLVPVMPRIFRQYRWAELRFITPQIYFVGIKFPAARLALASMYFQVVLWIYERRFKFESLSQQIAQICKIENNLSLPRKLHVGTRDIVMNNCNKSVDTSLHALPQSIIISPPRWKCEGETGQYYPVVPNPRV